MSKQVNKLTSILNENAISEEDFANCLGIDIAHAEAICAGRKKLSKTLARQIEQTFSKPHLWLELEDSDNQGSSYDLFG